MRKALEEKKMVKSETEEIYSCADDCVCELLFGEPAPPTYRTTITDDSVNPYNPTRYVGGGSTSEESQEMASERYQRRNQY